MATKVTIKDNEAQEKLLKRFSNRIKSRRLIHTFRKLRYFSQKPTKRKIRQSAVKREEYRAEAKKKEFLTS